MKYVKAKYGPYAENLSYVLNAVEGHLLSGYADGGDIPNKQIALVPGAQRDALAFLKNQPETNRRLDRVARLVDGFETPFGLELLSTVHWVMIREAKTHDDIIGLTYAWGQQKRKFSPRQIEIAVERLAEGGW